MIDAEDQYRYVLEQPVSRPAGTTYNYNGGLTALLAAILHKQSDEPLDELAQRKFFDPLGISDIEWIRYANGRPNAVSGLRMRPRDIAKIGQLMLNKGYWNGKSVVSPSWIEQSTTPQIHGDSLYFYGFNWWLGRSLINRREISWASAVGYGGQRLYIVPELDLVVVLAGLYASPVLQSVVGDIVLRQYALTAALTK